VSLGLNTLNLALTSLDRLLFILLTLFTFFYTSYSDNNVAFPLFTFELPPPPILNLERLDEVHFIRLGEVVDGVLTIPDDVQVSRTGAQHVPQVPHPVHRLAAIEDTEQAQALPLPVPASGLGG